METRTREETGMPLAPFEGLELVTDALCDTLRGRLAELGYTDRVIGEAEAVAPNLFDAVRLPLVHWSLERRGDPAATLARLFAYDGAAAEAAVRELLGAEIFAALLEAQVLEHHAAASRSVRSRYLLLPFERLWLLADHPWGGPDAVMGPGPTTLDLGSLIPPADPGLVLDVGCGAGTLALLAAARRARRAVGTDVNARAVAVARFNARLNGVSAEFLEGDLVAPVRGERFDLVVAQPPYVVLPPGTAAVTYLHGGPRGEEVALRLLGELPSVLAPRGRALLLVDAPVRGGEPLHHRFRAALKGAAGDLVLVAAAGPSPDGQALGYAAIEAPDLGPRYASAVRCYRQHLDTLGVKEFRHVLVVLRAPGADAPADGGLTATIPVGRLRGADSGSLDALLAALDVAALDDRSLGGQAVAAARHARWVQERAGPDPATEPVHRVHFRPGALGVDQELSEASLVLLGLLDSSASVDRAVERYAQICAAAPEEVRPRVLEFVRRSLGTGLLAPGA
jgi:SAM-dependent methyltransferase